MNSRLETLLRERFHPESVDRLLGGETFQDAGLDSMSVVEFLVLLNRDFDVPLDGDELRADSTLADAVDLLVSKGVPEA